MPITETTVPVMIIGTTEGVDPVIVAIEIPILGS